MVFAILCDIEMHVYAWVWLFYAVRFLWELEHIIESRLICIYTFLDRVALCAIAVAAGSLSSMRQTNRCFFCISTLSCIWVILAKVHIVGCNE